MAAIRTEPKTFNRLVSPSATESRISQLTQGSLVRVNLLNGQLEPRLAREWSGSADQLTWTLRLREDAMFSDGHPLTASDVEFTFAVLYDPKVDASMATNFMIGGKPLTVHVIDPHTVAIVFPSAYGPGLALLDVLPILPRHVLEPAFRAGKFREAWGLGTPPDQIVGAGPFMLKAYEPGQRVSFVRNPHFWRQTERGDPLPYLDGLDLVVIPEQNAEVLKMEAGDIDVTNDFVRAEDYATFKSLERKGAVNLVEAGVGIDPSALWFNLNPGAAAAKDRPWLVREELRRAISFAVDRSALVDTVFLGAGVPIYGPVTPGYGEWYLSDLPKTPYDAAQAKKLLASIGLTDRNGDGMLEDAANHPARFTLLTQKGNTVRERTSAVLKEQLQRVGLQVDVAAEEANTLRERYGKADYDAMFYGVNAGLTDPAFSQEMWLSSGRFHFWHPQQTKPETTWEATIDDAIQRQAKTTNRDERHQLFATAQRTLAEHLPVVYFAAQKVSVVLSARVRGAQPVVMQPPVLWNAEMLSIAGGASKGK